MSPYVQVWYNDAVVDRQAVGEPRLPGRMSGLDRDTRRSGAVMAAWARSDTPGYNTGDPLLLVLEQQVDEALAPRDDEHVQAWARRVAGAMFELLNIGHPPGWQHRSMCVGDVVIVGEVALGCAPAGWDLIDVAGSELREAVREL